MTNSTTTTVALVLSLGVLAGCGEAEEGVTTSDGQALYAAPHDDGNTFACATCHALSEPADDGITRPGHPIGDAAGRASFKNGQLNQLIDAVNACRQDWMGAPAFAEDDPRWLALRDFLGGGEAASAEDLSYEIVDPPADVSGGDATRGAATFDRTCSVCHGAGATGTVRAPSLLGTPESPEFIALKIRRSGNPQSDIYPDLTPGRMPFWAPDRLSDDELRDIVAFLVESEAEGPMITGEEVDLSQPGAQTDCGSTHPLVGRSLTFVEKSHDVGGTATVVDDCTLRFDDFSFDGGGIDVRIYGGQNGNYDNGPNMSINMVGSAFDGGSAILRLPEGTTLDDFDGLSVWCVPVGFSFGDGRFE